jgi:hypothetical protein
MSVMYFLRKASQTRPMVSVVGLYLPAKVGLFSLVFVFLAGAGAGSGMVALARLLLPGFLTSPASSPGFASAASACGFLDLDLAVALAFAFALVLLLVFGCFPLPLPWLSLFLSLSPLEPCHQDPSSLLAAAAA